MDHDAERGELSPISPGESGLTAGFASINAHLRDVRDSEEGPFEFVEHTFVLDRDHEIKDPAILEQPG